MPPRPVTVVKAAPPQRKDSKPKPQFHTPNPFAALANLDDEDAFPPLGSAATTTRSARSGSGTTTAGASDHSEIIGNAFMRGSSLPPANRPGGNASRTNVEGGARCVSMPLLTRTGGAGSGDVSLDGRRNSAYSTVSELLEGFPGSNSVMSLFVAGLPQISVQSIPDHNRMREDLLTHLAAFAPPLRAKLVPEIGPRRLLNYAFVDFRNEEDCNKVIQQGHNTLFRGLPIRLEFARGDRTIVLASPGNVDLQILKQSDESGTYGAEFRQEGVRWRNLTEELAARLCRPFGNVEKIQAGSAAVGESVVHVTFEFRGEARLAFAAFGNLPIKAHLSVHWLNSPNLTAASHQPRRPVHPHGPNAPASGLPRATRLSSCGNDEDYVDHAGSHFGDDDQDGHSNHSADEVRGREHTLEQRPHGSENGDPEDKTLTPPNSLNQLAKAMTELASDEVEIPTAQQDQKASKIQPSQGPDEGKPEPSKGAMKRRKKAAKKRWLQERASQRIDGSSHGPPAPIGAGEAQSQISVLENATDVQSQEAGHEQDTVDHPANEDDLPVNSDEPPFGSEERCFMPTTKSEISMRGDHSSDSYCITASTSEPLNQLYQSTLPANPPNAFFNSPPSSFHDQGVTVDLGQDVLVHHDANSGQDWPGPSSPVPLASTPQLTGSVAACDGTEVDDGNGDADSGPIAFVEQVREQPQEVYDRIYTRQRRGAQQASEGMTPGNWAEATDRGDLAANQTVPLITRRRSDITVADVSLPLVFRHGPNDGNHQFVGDAAPSPIESRRDEQANEATLGPLVSPVKHPDDLAEFYPHEPPTTSSGSQATLVPAESKTEHELVEQGCSIWVGGLPEDITPPALFTIFSACGCIKDVEVKRSMQKTSTFAFIMFADPHSIDKALELDGQVSNGFKLTVRKRTIKQLWVAGRPPVSHQPMPAAPPSFPMQQVPHALLPLPMRMPQLDTRSSVHEHGVGTSMSPTNFGNPYTQYYASPGTTYQNVDVFQADAGRGSQIYGSPRLENDHRMVFQNVNGRGRSKGNRRGKALKPRVADQFSQRGSKDFAPHITVAGAALDASSQPAVMNWGTLAQRGQSLQNLNGHHPAGVPRVAQPQQHGVLTNAHTTPQPQASTLHDSAILSSSEAQSSPAALHYRGGGMYYPGGFYATGGAPISSFIPQTAEYYQNGYGSYMYPTYMPGQPWVYPHQYGAQPTAGTHSAPAPGYNAEADAYASSGTNVGGGFVHPNVAAMGPNTATYFNTFHSHATPFPQMTAQSNGSVAPSEAVTPALTSGYSSSAASNNNNTGDGDRVFSGTSSYMPPQVNRRGRRGHARSYQPHRNQSQRDGTQG
ncbi:unnamed protein product [Tilletia controversa]|nr:unnamed protein product [Tilletia controversa]CAD6927487.1 unnamed protein product [Tilletia controversa]CAD6971174.1 unnamed protein product [Tilletia controversa]